MFNIFKQKPFPASILFLFIVIFLHYIGSLYSWYWLYPQFDIIVHVLSGLWLSLTILWLASVLGQINSLKEYKVKSFLIAFISAILFGVIWELVENYWQISGVAYAGYALDTALDILNGGLGGILAYLYFIKKKRCNLNTCEQDNLPSFYNQMGIVKH